VLRRGGTEDRRAKKSSDGEGKASTEKPIGIEGSSFREEAEKKKKTPGGWASP